MILVFFILSLIFIIIYELFKNLLNLSDFGLISYIINIISTSFLASSIFYYVQSYRPQKLKLKKSYLVIEPYLIKLNYDLQIFIGWINGIYSFDKNGNLMSTSKSQHEMLYLVKAPNQIKPLLMQIKNRIIHIKTTGLSENLDFDLNIILNNILSFVEAELCEDLYCNNYLDSLYLGNFIQKSQIIMEGSCFLNEHISKKYKKGKF